MAVVGIVDHITADQISPPPADNNNKKYYVFTNNKYELEVSSKFTNKIRRRKVISGSFLLALLAYYCISFVVAFIQAYLCMTIL